jgi:hypothetical protein
MANGTTLFFHKCDSYFCALPYFAESANARSTSATHPSIVRLLGISDRHSLKLNAENLKLLSHGLLLPQIR